MGEDKERRRTEGGLHVGHAEEEKEIKRRRKKTRETDTQDFPGTRKARVKDQNDREKGGD